MLDRLEEAYGVGWTRGFANLIAVSRQGWRESDLRVLLPQAAQLAAPDEPEEAWNDLRFATLRRGFRAHLVERGAERQWDFFHAQMRLAVEERNQSDPDDVKQLHLLIADHLHALPEADLIRQSELMFHLIHADDKERAARVYAEEQEIGSATKALREHLLEHKHHGPNAGLKWVLSLLTLPQLGSQERARLCRRCQSHLMDAIENDALSAQLSLAHGILQAFEQLVAEDPQKLMWQRDLSISHNNIGDLLRAQGDSVRALAAYETGLAVAESLTRLDQSNTEWQRILLANQHKVGELLLERGDTQSALAACRASLAAAERLTSLDTDPAALHNLLVFQAQQGDVLLKTGETVDAVTAYRSALGIAERLASAESANARWQRDLAASHHRLARALLREGDLKAAEIESRASLEIMERLFGSDDKDRHEFWEDLSGAYGCIGDVWLAQGDREGALFAYDRSNSLAEILSSLDPGNTHWQEQRALTRGRVGDSLRAHGDTKHALLAYCRAMVILERLCDLDSGNSEWQRNLGTSHDRIAEVLCAETLIEGALIACRASLTIRQRLASEDPGNLELEHEVAIRHGHVGDVLLAQGKTEHALSAYRASLAIAQRLALLDPANADWQQAAAVGHGRLGDVFLEQGEVERALRQYRASIAVREEAVRARPDDRQWQRDLGAYYRKVGDLLVVQTQSDAALVAYEASRSIAEGLLLLEPENTQWADDVKATCCRIGDLLRQRGDAKGAIRTYSALLPVAHRMVSLDAVNAHWENVLASLHRVLGDLMRNNGDTVGAVNAYREALASGQRFATSSSVNVQWMTEQWGIQKSIGELLTALGDVGGAVTAYGASVGLAQCALDSLSADTPECGEWLARLYACHSSAASLVETHGDTEGAEMSHRELGDVLRAKGYTEGALTMYRAGLDIAERMDSAGPANPHWQRALVAGHGKLGDVLFERGEYDEALVAHRSSLVAAERLAASGLSSTACQRTLSVCHERIGDVLRKQEDAAGALAAYRASLEIRDQVAKSDLTDTDAQHLLAVSQARVGDLQRAEGQLEAALEAFTAAQVIAAGLVSLDLASAERQSELRETWTCVVQIARDVARGNPQAAVNAYRKSLAALERLAAQDPTNAQWQQYTAHGHLFLGDALLDQGDEEGAADAYGTVRKIVENGASRDEQLLCLVYDKLGDVSYRLGRTDQAYAALRLAIDSRQRLAAAEPTNTDYQRGLAQAHHRLACLCHQSGLLPEAVRSGRSAAAVLKSMREKGMPLEPSEQQLLEALENLESALGASSR